MGSICCKPGDMRQECSPKLNVQALINRFSLQMCPTKCRYPKTSSQQRTKPRPRSVTLSQGKRPDISSPLAHPIPPPRKKRKCTLELSRSEETLCRQNALNSSLTAACSLPSVYEGKTIVLNNGIEIKPPMASIMEESSNIYYPENNESEIDSLPPSDVYFLKKEPLPIVFADAKSVAEIKENDEYLSNKKPMSDTFSSSNEQILTLDKFKQKEKIIKNETNMVNEDKGKSCVEKCTNNKLNFLKDQTDLESIKKWQDAMKKRWLQNILNEGEPNNINNTVTVNGSLQINTSLNKSNTEFIDINNSEKSDTKTDFVSDTQNKSTTNKIYENIIKNTQECVPNLLVIPKNLSDTLEQSNNTQSSNQETVHSNGVSSIDTSLSIDNKHNNSKETNDLNNEILTDKNIKTHLNPDEKLHSHSRHPSITDSLKEFESSIYDMLQQSAKDNASDDDDSLLIVNIKNCNNKTKNSIDNSRIESIETC